MTQNNSLMIVLTLIVLSTIVYGFMDGGSPKAAKDNRDDSTRYQNIYTIKGNITNYYSEFKALPITLMEAARPASHSVTSGADLGYFNDPVTKAPYEYKILSEKEFKLCATFATDTTKTTDQYMIQYAHPAGYYCFSFAGDKY